MSTLILYKLATKNYRKRDRNTSHRENTTSVEKFKRFNLSKHIQPQTIYTTTAQTRNSDQRNLIIENYSPEL